MDLVVKYRMFAEAEAASSILVVVHDTWESHTSDMHLGVQKGPCMQYMFAGTYRLISV